MNEYAGVIARKFYVGSTCIAEQDAKTGELTIFDQKAWDKYMVAFYSYHVSVIDTVKEDEHAIEESVR